MTPQDIEKQIEKSLTPDFVLAESQDNVHFYVTVVSSQFESLNKIKQHKLVLDLFREALSNETIHALSVKTFTPEKWKTLQEKTT